VCSLPPEYCEFGPSFEKCKPWLLENCPDLYPQLKEEAELKKKMGSLSVGQSSSGSKKDDSKKSEDVKMLPGGKIKKKEEPFVTVARTNRMKKKFITTVTGLDGFGVKLTDATKLFSKKFSCGSSVVKGDVKDYIDVQGDVKEDIVDEILDNFDIPESAIYFIEEGNKKVKARP